MFEKTKTYFKNLFYCQSIAKDRAKLEKMHTTILKELTDTYDRVAYYKTECDKIIQAYDETILKKQNQFLKMPEYDTAISTYVDTFVISCFPKNSYAESKTVLMNIVFPDSEEYALHLAESMVNQKDFIQDLKKKIHKEICRIRSRG